MGKKKGKSGGKKGKKIVDGISTSEMTRDQMLGHIRRLQSEIDREREERNFFMLEREKLFSLWSVALEKINIEKNQARLREIHLDNEEEKKQNEVGFYKQKLRFTVSQHSKSISETRLNYLIRIRQAQNDMWTTAKELKEKERILNRRLGSSMHNFNKILQEIEQRHLEEVRNLRGEFLKSVLKNRAEAEIQMRNYRQETDLRTKNEVMELQNVKNGQIDDLIKLHEEQLEELRSYFSIVNRNNIALIEHLESEINSKNDEEEKLNFLLRETRNKNTSLQKSIEDLQSQILETSPEEKKIARRFNEVKRSDKMIARVRGEIRKMECAAEVLLIENKGIEDEKKELRNSMGRAIMEIQKKSVMKQMINRFQNQNFN